MFEQAAVAPLAFVDLGHLPRALGGVAQRASQLLGVNTALDQIVGRAGAERLLVHVGIAVPGEHHHRTVRAAFGHGQPHQVHAVVRPQLVVHQEHVVAVLAQRAHAVGQGRRPLQLEAALPVVRQQVAQDQEIFFVVIHHQHAKRRIVQAPPPVVSPGRSTISSQYLPRVCTTSISAEKLTGLEMNEFTPSS